MMPDDPSGSDPRDDQRGGIHPFPPLPPVPAPPGSALDSRQRGAHRIVRALGDVAGDHMQLAGPNLTAGYRASAVDLAALQDVIESALSRLGPEALSERWETDVRSWVQRTLMTWVQRVKSLSLGFHGDGLSIELQTQDDYGYYHYRFEAIPQRGQPKAG